MMKRMGLHPAQLCGDPLRRLSAGHRCRRPTESPPEIAIHGGLSRIIERIVGLKIHRAGLAAHDPRDADQVGGGKPWVAEMHVRPPKERNATSQELLLKRTERGFVRGDAAGRQVGSQREGCEHTSRFTDVPLHGVKSVCAVGDVRRPDVFAGRQEIGDANWDKGAKRYLKWFYRNPVTRHSDAPKSMDIECPVIADAARIIVILGPGPRVEALVQVLLHDRILSLNAARFSNVRLRRRAVGRAELIGPNFEVWISKPGAVVARKLSLQPIHVTQRRLASGLDDLSVPSRIARRKRRLLVVVGAHIEHAQIARKSGIVEIRCANVPAVAPHIHRLSEHLLDVAIDDRVVLLRLHCIVGSGLRDRMILAGWPSLECDDHRDRLNPVGMRNVGCLWFVVSALASAPITCSTPAMSIRSPKSVASRKYFAVNAVETPFGSTAVMLCSASPAEFAAVTRRFSRTWTEGSAWSCCNRT